MFTVCLHEFSAQIFYHLPVGGVGLCSEGTSSSALKLLGNSKLALQDKNEDQIVKSPSSCSTNQ